MPEQPNQHLFNGHASRLLFLLVATLFCFFWGLDSPFLFDDTPNLDPLAFLTDASIFSRDFWEFVFSGESGPTGRPVSLFSFVLQASDWPNNPWRFKLVNLLIHALNASLVYGVSFQLTRILAKDSSQGFQISLLVALAWALHPIHTSTVFYAVQRMALLSNLFILTGIYFHLYLRTLDFSRHPLRQVVYLSISLGVTGLLGLFSKENALSLVFYLLCLEYTVLKKLQADRIFRIWRATFLWLPLALTALLPLVYIDSLRTDFAANFSFTMGERVLTETRILWHYLATLLIPTTGSIGIFQDIPVSSSLLSPVTTLASVLAWLTLLLLSILKPGKFRLPLFALFWFLSGHIVESTILPLELVFQHRNYLAFFGLFFTLVYSLFTWTPENILQGKQKIFLCALYLVLLAINTVRISTLWSNPLLLAERWYDNDPATSRNVEFYAFELANFGSQGEILAADIFNTALDNNPGNFRYLINLMTMACVNNAITAPDREVLLQAATNLGPEDRNLAYPIRQISDLSLQGNCSAYPPAFIAELLEVLVNEVSTQERGVILYDLARFSNSIGENESATRLFKAAFEISGDSDILFNLALQLVNSGQYEEALETLDLAIASTRRNNNIRTGTRSSKLELLNGMREDVLGFINAANQN